MVYHNAHAIAYERRLDNDRLLIVANMGDKPLTLALPGRWQRFDEDAPVRTLTVAPIQACIFKEVRA